MTPMKQLLEHEGALSGDMFVHKGENVKPRRAGNDASGYVIVEGSTFSKVKKRMLGILRDFRIISRTE